MKTLITAAIFTFGTSAAPAHDYAQAFKSPDVDPIYLNRSTAEFAPVKASNAPISLYQFARGNPDLYYGEHSDAAASRTASRGEPEPIRNGLTSLERWSLGNPDSGSELWSRDSGT